MKVKVINIDGNTDTDIELSDKIFSLSLLEKDQTFSSYINYKYVADLRCSDIKNGILIIWIDANKKRTYRIHFNEGVERKLQYHLELVT